MIQLLPFGPPDFDQLIAWISSNELLAQFAGPLFNYPLTHYQLEKYIADKDRLVYKAVSASRVTIGHAEIFLHDEASATFCRILVGDEQQRGKGHGQQIINQLLAIAFNRPGIVTVSLNVYDWNLPAIKCYEKAGFTVNPGKVRKQTVNNQVWTAMNMSITKEDWERLRRQALNTDAR
jgi:RimJ/RimL family protein N-acetyltransferase